MMSALTFNRNLPLRERQMSALTFRNQTPHIAQFVAKRGQQIIARLPNVAPQAELKAPSDDVYSVVAATIMEGNTRSTAPVTVTGPMRFLAQIKLNAPHGTYDFEMLTMSSPLADQLVFQTTTRGPVTFTISKNGTPLQSVVVRDSLKAESLRIDLTYSVYAVIYGVTTEIVQTTNPNAVITAVVDNSKLEPGNFSLTIA
jgi:hypothetical protein